MSTAAVCNDQCCHHNDDNRKPLPDWKPQETRRQTEVLLNRLEQRDFGGTPTAFYFMFHPMTGQLRWIRSGAEWEDVKKSLLLQCPLRYSSSFRDVWRSEAGHCYNLLYHEFVRTDTPRQRHTASSLKLATLCNRLIPAWTLVAEMVPISEAEYVRLGAQYLVLCANKTCSLTGLSMFCARCKTTLYCSRKCQKEHWREHKRDCIVAAPATESTTVCQEQNVVDRFLVVQQREARLK